MRFLATLTIDLSIAVGVGFAIQDRLGAMPVPKRWDAVGIVGVYLILLLGAQLLFRGSPGFHAWKIGWLDARMNPVRWNPAGSGLYSLVKLEGASLAIAILLSVVTPVAAGSAIHWRLSAHPLWMEGQAVALSPYVPSASAVAGADSWSSAAFFYTLGAWPRSFSGHPILYSLPYAKGPPQQFVPSIQARWEMPEIRVTLEGPRTPWAFQANPERAIEDLRTCVSGAPWEDASDGRSCVEVRSLAIERHLREMRAIRPTRWQLRWFEVENSALPTEERPRGIHLLAEGQDRVQERYLLVNARGVHQAILLSRPRNERGELARMMLEQVVRSQRVFAELGAPRAWANQSLPSVRWEEIQKAEKTEAFVAKIAEIHLRLLSKISVDPKTFDSYYHLAGTALQLARYAALRQNSDWSAVARPLIQSAYRYAQDVAPSDTRLTQFERIWIDARRL